MNTAAALCPASSRFRSQAVSPAAHGCGKKMEVPLMLLELLNSLSHIFYMALHVVNSGSFPRPLPAAEERRCLEAYRQNGDLDARNRLIEHNLRLVAHIIKKYYSSVRDQDDLISIGTIGLIKAVGTFDYTKGTRLATY